MLDLLWMIPALPFGASLVLALAGGSLGRPAVAALGTAPLGLSAILSLGIGASFLSSAPQERAFTQDLWTWIHSSGLEASVSLYLDPLSLVMTVVVAVVGFLILLYSAEFMAEDPGQSRFYSYMNLFVGFMIVLLLADNLLLLYLGWEGVGLCSYLLIGFWYADPRNGAAARKAFIVTRAGDTAMAVALLILFTSLGTLEIQDLMRRAQEQWPVGTPLAIAAAALLLAGAVGKSAQLPLQTWLPDAMAGPTPVSALIHAATMVTAGVYLIARTHVLFLLAPAVQAAVAVIGALTLLLAAFSALAQRDLKRVLAYSTMSQVGYMFLALGLGAWTAAIFHFATHAFFKALLFLGAGAVIHGLKGEHDMFRMGGLRRALPVPFWTFVAGASSLAAIPLVTAGFYSKDLIVWFAWSSEKGSGWLWAAGALGAFLTSLYTFRMLFLTFFGAQTTSVSRPPGALMQAPLIALALMSTFAGFIEVPPLLGDVRLLSHFMEHTLPGTRLVSDNATLELVLLLILEALQVAAIFLAYLLYLRAPRYGDVLREAIPFGESVRRLWFSGWGFDRLYDLMIVRPLSALARANRDDLFDLIPGGLAFYTDALHRALRRSQTGRVRWYVMAVALGAVISLGFIALGVHP